MALVLLLARVAWILNRLSEFAEAVEFFPVSVVDDIDKLRPQNIKIYPKIQSKSNVRIERNKENESYSTTWVEPKTVFEPYPNPKNSPLGPQKVKNDPKIKSK